MVRGATGLQRELTARLLARTPEIEETILTRVYAVSDPTAVSDPEYLSGLRAAVGAAVRYGLRGIEIGRAAGVSIPVELLAQVRSAARNRVPLDTVLRRYVAGHTLLSDFVVQEARETKLADARDLQRLVRLQAELFDRVVEVIAAEYQVGLESAHRSSGDDRAHCVDRLLAGQLVDPEALGYELSGWHLGLVVSGPDAGPILREFARSRDRRLLLVDRADEVHWAWLGSARPPGPEDFASLTAQQWTGRTRASVGEVGAGLNGWRLTHRQALTALPVALGSSEPVVRYADVALLALALKDEVLAASLRQLYLDPLEAERDTGQGLRETLRAYFDAGRNAASAAAALGVTRQTVNNRLRVAEECLRRPLSACAVELELALALQDHDPVSTDAFGTRS